MKLKELGGIFWDEGIFFKNLKLGGKVTTKF